MASCRSARCWTWIVHPAAICWVRARISTPSTHVVAQGKVGKHLHQCGHQPATRVRRDALLREPGVLTPRRPEYLQRVMRYAGVGQALRQALDVVLAMQ